MANDTERAEVAEEAMRIMERYETVSCEGDVPCADCGATDVGVGRVPAWGDHPPLCDLCIGNCWEADDADRDPETGAALPTYPDEMVEFARRHCKITRPDFARYNAALEFRPTPEEYEHGFREAYSPEAYLARARHEWTNYEWLLGCIPGGAVCRTTAEDRLDGAIKDRIDVLVAERRAALGIAFDDFDEEDPSS